MIFEPTTPKTSRSRFKLRTIHNFVALFAIFIVLVAVISMVSSMWSFPMLMGDAIAFGIVYYLFTLWDKRPIGMECNHCGKYLASNTPWVCGYCKKPNTNANDYPFLGPCAHCGNEPKAYKCHHKDCGQLIFFSEDMDGSNYAYCLNSPNESAADPRTLKVIEREESKQEKEHALLMAELDTKLKDAKAKLDGPKIKSPRELQQEKFDKFYRGVMGSEEIADEALAQVRIKFKDDPTALARREATIQAWLRLNVP